MLKLNLNGLVLYSFLKNPPKQKNKQTQNNINKQTNKQINKYMMVSWKEGYILFSDTFNTLCMIYGGGSRSDLHMG